MERISSMGNDEIWGKIVGEVGFWMATLLDGVGLALR